MDKSELKSNVAVIVGNCLACGGLVRVSANTKATSKVRCPLCSESFLLQQMLDTSVPELEVIDPDESPSAGTKTGTESRADGAVSQESDGDDVPKKFVVPRQLTQGAKRKRRRRKKESSEDSVSPTPFRPLTEGNNEPENGAPLKGLGSGIADLSETGDLSETSDLSETGDRSTAGATSRDTEGSRRSGSGQSSSGRSSSARGSRRSASKGRSPFFEGMKIAVGGALAFPIAYLMMFWFFKQDPLKLGPSIGRVAPFMVPEELMAEDAEGEKQSPAKATEGVNDESESSEEGDSGFEFDSLPVPDVDPDKLNMEDFDPLID